MKAKCMILVFIVLSIKIYAQDSTRVHFSSSIGIFMPLSTFSKSYERSLSLGSGLEYLINKKCFLLGEVAFNAVKYNQQFRDKNSNFLFQNTNSSVISVGLNISRIVKFKPASAFSLSPYVGLGYVNIGEPRLMVDIASQIAKQEVTRMQGVFTKVGTRIELKTNIIAIKNVFLNISYWNTNLQIQESKPKVLSLVLGTKVGF